MKLDPSQKNNCNSSFDIVYDFNYSFSRSPFYLDKLSFCIQRNIILNRKSCFF